MQSLYNIAGFLGAQSRSNPSDHGDSWDSHKAMQPKLQPRNATSRQECIATLDLLTQLNKRYLEVTHEPKLTPINLRTLNVGDTVRLVGDQSASEYWGINLTIGKDYKVFLIDRDDIEMPIQILDNAGCVIWIYGEDIMQVI